MDFLTPCRTWCRSSYPWQRRSGLWWWQKSPWNTLWQCVQFCRRTAEVLLEMVLSLCLRELAIFSELQGKVGVGLLLVSIATASVSVTGVTGVAGVTLSAVIIFIFIGVLSGVCFFVALPFIVRVLVLVGGRIFLGHLGAALPILGVDGLGKGTEFVEGVGFADAGNLVLDAGRKSAIHLSAEGGVAPLDTGG